MAKKDKEIWHYTASKEGGHKRGWTILCMRGGDGVGLASGHKWSDRPEGVTCKRCLKLMALRKKAKKFMPNPTREQLPPWIKATKALALKLAAKYGWDDFELNHALEAMKDRYGGDETIVKLPNGKAIHAPAYDAPCDYVRLVQDGYELAYWHCDEWKESPAEVMGAIIGAMKGP